MGFSPTLPKKLKSKFLTTNTKLLYTNSKMPFEGVFSAYIRPGIHY